MKYKVIENQLDLDHIKLEKVIDFPREVLPNSTYFCYGLACRWNYADDFIKVEIIITKENPLSDTGLGDKYTRISLL